MATVASVLDLATEKIQPGDAALEELETLNGILSAPAANEAPAHPAAAQHVLGAQVAVVLAAEHGLVGEAVVEAGWGIASEAARSIAEDDGATFAQGIANYFVVAFAAETPGKADTAAPTSEHPEQATEDSAMH